MPSPPSSSRLRAAEADPGLGGSAVLTPGTVLAGKYRVEKTLGSGGMGLVVSAHHQALDQRVAIKCLTAAALDYPDVLERFAREARAAARIKSEHVARVIDVGHLESGLPFIVLEYLEGEDLATHLSRKGQLRVSTAVRYALEVCEVLAEAHAAKIIHRDIKPANLFIAAQRDRRRIVKVLDFGVSKLTDEPVTKTSTMLGTVTYMSPEQLRSAKEVDDRTDIWALGAVLYEMLSGTPPFVGNNTAELVNRVLNEPPPSIKTHRTDLPERLVEVVERCLRIEPADRYPSALDLATDLASFANDEDRVSVNTIRRVTGTSIAPLSSEGDSIRPRTSAIVVLDADAGEVTNTMMSPVAKASGERPTDGSSPPPNKVISEVRRPSERKLEVASPAPAISEAKDSERPASVARPRSFLHGLDPRLVFGLGVLFSVVLAVIVWRLAQTP